MSKYTPEQLEKAGKAARYVWEQSQARPSGHRNKQETLVLDWLLMVLTELEHPMTVRAVYYRVVSFGAMSKDKDGYRKITHALTRLRETGVVPYEYLTDGSRGMTEEPSWPGPAVAIRALMRQYRRPVWTDQPVDLIMAAEKDAIVTTVYDACLEPYDVPLVVMRGYDSLSLAWKVHKRISATKPTVILQLGDHDASGLDAWRAAEKRLRILLDEASKDPDLVTFRRLAVTPEQINDPGNGRPLLTRESNPNDPRHKKWAAAERAAGRSGEAVEVDAIPPAILRRIVAEAVESYLDRDAYDQTVARQGADVERLAA